MMNENLDRAEASLQMAEHFIRRAVNERNPLDRRFLFLKAKEYQDDCRHFLAASERSVGPSSGTDSGRQPSLTGGPKVLPLDDGAELDISGTSLQPRGAGGPDVPQTAQPGGIDPDNMDDGGTPDGLDARHHASLVGHGYTHTGDGVYSHPSGKTAQSGLDDSGAPKTTVGGQEFDDASELDAFLDRIHGSGSSPLGDPDERTARSFAAAHGSGPDVVEWTMAQLRAFRERPNLFRSGSDLSFESWLATNWRFEKGGGR
jgi:hypothetical protein